MDTPQYQIAQKIAARFSQLPEVEAIAVAGSVATGRANAASDVDIYVYPSVDISAKTRLTIGQEFSLTVEVSDYWGPAITWVDAQTGIEIEVMFFNTPWMEGLVLDPLEKHQAKMGFTTSFWHTIKVSKPLFDRNGWLARLQEKANQPYPQELVQTIVNLNFPLLREIAFSYRQQTAQAIQRGDVIKASLTVSDFLVSYFDIVFAVNQMPHPGVKRMLEIVEHECEKQPTQLREIVTRLLRAVGSGSENAISAVDSLVDNLTILLRSEGLI
jgi:predicted nucleotidyltransferase